MPKLKPKTDTIFCEPREIYLVAKKGIKVYPIIATTTKWQIQVDDNGKLTTYDKKLSQHEINDAVAKTIKFYYNKLN